MVLDGGLTCVECSSSRVWLDYDGGEVVCMACGAVLPEYGVEVMNGNSYEVSYDPDGLKEIRTRLRGTMVGWGVYGPGMVDGKGRRLNMAESETAVRHVRFESRNLAGSCLIRMVRIVEGTTARLHLPKIVGARAVEIYRRAHAAGIRRPLRRISSAAIYIACCENQIPIQMKQIVHPADRRLVWRMHNRIIFALNLNPRKVGDMQFTGRRESWDRQNNPGKR
jgi:transcription initiation factor TFIIIB Brf1 subunit/transcription initiation factor TFIIB